MSLILPEWVAHYSDDSKKKRSTIFSVHVHPDSSRLATAGLDTKIRIWATEPILDPDTDALPNTNRLLSTLSRHTGSVLVVRWSHSGRYLASGSDDTVGLIWDHDPSGLSSGTFGSTEVNVEQWRPHRRLAGHESDVTDLAWAEDDEYIATVGLDSLVFVWSGTTFEKLRRIDGHQGFVKGVVWDPLGQYLATASDDKSVKVWRTSDWGVESSITEPFATSPSSTFFRRPSWSPDGSLLVTSNAMSQKVFVASVVKRVSWSSDIFFVGHENSVVVSAFSPRLFKGFDEGPQAMVLALGSLDQSVSVWVTGLEKPVLVARDVFERQVLDLSWSSDGYTLYACSSDGTVAVFSLTPDEISDALSNDTLLKAREVFGYKKPRSLLSATAATPVAGTIERPNVLQVRKAGSRAQAQAANAPAAVAGPPKASAVPQRLKQQITINKDGKRRIKPTLHGSQDVHMEQASLPSPAKQTSQHFRDVMGATTPPRAFSGADNSMDLSGGGGSTADFGSVMESTPVLKRKASLLSGDDIEPLSKMQRPKGKGEVGRTLGGDGPREAAGPAVALRKSIAASSYGVNGQMTHGPALPIPELLSVARREEADGIIEIRNFDDGRPAEIASIDTSAGGKDQEKVIWVDYSPSPALTATISTNFSAVGLEDGTINVYSSKGRKLTNLLLDAPVFRLDSSSSVLLAITTSGMMHRWDVKAGKELHRPVSVLGVLGDPSKLVSFSISSNGVPILVLNSEQAYTFDPAKLCFVCISSGFFADHSSAWEGRTRGRGNDLNGNNRDPIKTLEAEINNLVVSRSETGIEPCPAPPNSNDFTIAITLKHLETRLTAAVLLDSPSEYKIYLGQYARKLAEEGIRNQAEDLIKSLLGPVYHKPGQNDDWDPNLLGHEKRALLGTVLQIFAKGRLLTGLAQPYQEILSAMRN
ncbi:WD40 repeat-like protein [Violaceomyces palustris]|uniref:WD40 repeat-like protein n=1 Tax=Violaceomyces palustris TaxID=1673888 RepID=A0ACD0NR06_9BASI|nr:WD40 repeat-like protein [Violaceomyces palustris]